MSLQLQLPPQTTTVLSQAQSLQVAMIFLNSTISTLCYERQIFSQKCFEERYLHDDDEPPTYDGYLKSRASDRAGQHARSILSMRTLRRGIRTGPDTLLDWIERSAIPILERKCLRAIVVRVHSDRDMAKGAVEEYTLAVQYPTMDAEKEQTSHASSIGTGSGTPTLRYVQEQFKTANEQLLQSCTDHSRLPRRKFVSLVIQHVLPDGEAPHGFSNAPFIFQGDGIGPERRSKYAKQSSGAYAQDYDALPLACNLPKLAPIATIDTGAQRFSFYASDVVIQSTQPITKLPQELPQPRHPPPFRVPPPRHTFSLDPSSSLNGPAGQPVARPTTLSQVSRGRRLRSHLRDMKLPLAEATQSTMLARSSMAPVNTSQFSIKSSANTVSQSQEPRYSEHSRSQTTVSQHFSQSQSIGSQILGQSQPLDPNLLSKLASYQSSSHPSQSQPLDSQFLSKLANYKPPSDPYRPNSMPPPSAQPQAYNHNPLPASQSLPMDLESPIQVRPHSAATCDITADPRYTPPPFSAQPPPMDIDSYSLAQDRAQLAAIDNSNIAANARFMHNLLSESHKTQTDVTSGTTLPGFRNNEEEIPHPKNGSYETSQAQAGAPTADESPDIFSFGARRGTRLHSYSENRARLANLDTIQAECFSS